MKEPVRVFIGVDPRQPVAFSVLASSLAWNSKRPVSIIPLRLPHLPITRRGLTEFTFARFLVPYLCDFRGSAIFMDADILVTGDIGELIDCADSSYDVQVMQDQPRFEWPSVMLFNNARCRVLTPEYVQNDKNQLFDLAWAKSVGTFPKEWNSCVGYGDAVEANLYHYTQGVPCWPETRGNHPQDALWLQEHKRANSTVDWKSLMGSSVHAPLTMKAMKIRQLRESNVELVTGGGSHVDYA